jgi:hypothetical protein
VVKFDPETGATVIDPEINIASLRDGARWIMFSLIEQFDRTPG